MIQYLSKKIYNYIFFKTFLYMVINMPIITKKGLPANDILREEKIQILDELADGCSRSEKVLQIAILNLMPLKEDTELQLLRKLSKAQKNIKITFFNVISYIGKTTNPEHMEKYYSTFEELKDKYFDGLIITGAPVEQMDFEAVAYWGELTRIIDWSKTNVKSTIYICWGAQAGLYYNYGINKELMDDKKFGVFSHHILDKSSKLLYGFEDGFVAPHSRHTTVRREDIEKHSELTIVSESDEAGVFIVENKDKNEIYVTGHVEYDQYTLDKEYRRDLSKGLKIEMPKNYYKDDDYNNEPNFSWKENGDKLYSNWVNFYLTKN